MKFIISFLLQFPLYYVLANGFIALTGLNIWLSIPICVTIGLCYDIGEMIRKDFLPFEPMRNYRIKKETYNNHTKYYPQEKRLFWWVNVFAFDVYFDGGYDTLEDAKKNLCDYCKGTMVEYLDFDPNEDCK